MKSANDILKEALIGKTLIKRAFDDEPKWNHKIADVSVAMDESREDAKLYITLEVDGTDDEGMVEVYMNEGLELK
jgi:hypothetical protein